MTNVRVMHGEYSKEKDYYLFGYTYIPKDESIDVSAVQKNAVNDDFIKKKQYGKFTFVFDNK